MVKRDAEKIDRIFRQALVQTGNRRIIDHRRAWTTSACLQADIPNIVVPFAVDQPFWGRRVHAIGAGPEPIPVKKLTVEKLTKAILEAETSTYREWSAVLGQKIRSWNR